ncbi:MAG: hypothetical protein H6575_19640 [Lewinellaceae bacterium]|nr:hypothetical protein [Lewinellaceae bacterium]
MIPILIMCFMWRRAAGLSGQAIGERGEGRCFAPEKTCDLPASLRQQDAKIFKTKAELSEPVFRLSLHRSLKYWCRHTIDFNVIPANINNSTGFCICIVEKMPDHRIPAQQLA